MNRLMFIFFLIFGLTNCTSLTIRHSQDEAIGRADFVGHYEYYWLGFQGQHQISLAEICIDETPVRTERLMTAEDWFLTIVSFGIYMPVTYKVWCKPNSAVTSSSPDSNS